MSVKLDLFQLIGKRLDWLTHRHSVLAQNVANANTPDYQAKDLSERPFQNLLRNFTPSLVAKTTRAGHISPSQTSSMAKVLVNKNPYEVSPTGNSVVLEEQMIHISKTRGSYETMVALHRKHAEMLRTAIRGPGV